MREQLITEYMATFDLARCAKALTLSQNRVRDILKERYVREEIERRLALKLEIAEIHADRIIVELKRIAFSDLRHLFDAEGHLVSLNDLPPHMTAFIQGIEVEEREDGARVTKVRLWPKMTALEVLARIAGILTDQPSETKVEFSWKEDTLPPSPPKQISAAILTPK